jgi:hypothetical protein
MRRAGWLLPVVVFCVIWGLTTHGKFSVSGDEPHYLLMTESVRSDGDVDLRDDYALRSSERFGAMDLQPGLHAKEALDGQLRSAHEPGLAIIVLPAYVVARQLAQQVPEPWLRTFRMGRGLFVYALVSLFLVAVTCTGLALLLDTTTHLSRPGIGLWITAAVGLAPPVLSVGFLVFPEVPAFVVVALVLWTCWGRGAGLRWTPLASAAALGLLPWFHRKFTFFALGLLFVLAWNRWRDVDRPRGAVLAAAALFTVPMITFYLCTWLWWGNVLGPMAQDRVPFAWSVFEVGAPGLLFDREHGLLVWAPIYLVAGAAWWRTRVWSWPLLVPTAALLVPCAALEMWWAGFAPAARFVVPVVPFLACVLAGSLHHPVFARLFATLCVAQVAISAIGWQWPRTLWPRGDGHNRVLESIPLVGAPINDALPSFRTGDAGVWIGVLGILVLAALSAALVALTRRTDETARQ